MFLAVREKAVRRARLALEFAASQGLAQAAGMISGLIYVRVMPVDQYALYALGAACLMFMSGGSDLGLTGSLSYFWRQSGKDGSHFDPRIAAVRRLRPMLLLGAALISGSLLLLTAAQQNLAIGSVLACFAVVLATASSQLHTTVGLQLMRLEARQRESYYCEAAGSIARLLAAIAMILTGITTAVFGLFGGLLGSLAIVAALWGSGRTSENTAKAIPRETWHEIRRYIIPMLPTMIVHMVQDPLVLWLAMTFGGQAQLSETFAVGRIGAIYAVLGNFIIVVVAPRLARTNDDTRFARMAAQFLLALALVCAAMTMLAHLAPSALLLLIGPKYAHLDREVVLAMAAASFSVLISFVAITNRLRGWVRMEPVVALCQALAIVILASNWSFSDSASVLLLSVILAGFSFFCVTVTSIIGLLAPAIVKTP